MLFWIQLDLFFLMLLCIIQKWHAKSIGQPEFFLTSLLSFILFQ